MNVKLLYINSICEKKNRFNGFPLLGPCGLDSPYMHLIL